MRLSPGEPHPPKRRRCPIPRALRIRGRGGFLYKLGVVSYTIRILMYPACILHVSCMYPEGYMYLECILMYLKCILHALLHSKRIHVSFTLCMYFTRIPNESKIHFGIHMRYITILVSWARPWCHTGYMSGYIRIHVSWTLHHDTSGYTGIQN